MLLFELRRTTFSQQTNTYFLDYNHFIASLFGYDNAPAIIKCAKVDHASDALEACKSCTFCMVGLDIT